MYQYPVEQCDISNQERLLLYRSKRAEWINWLRGNDSHSIWRQINNLLWEDLLFRTVNDLRRNAIEYPSKDVGFNDAVLRLFDAGFVTTQVTAIRRLTDKQPRDPKKGVISISRLITDIRQHSHLVTREMYVSYNGLPYDPEPLYSACIEKKLANEDLKCMSLEFGMAPTNWSMSQMIHENFDKLSKVTPDNRSRTDVIAPEWFDWLESCLVVCNDIRKYTYKFVAHAAEPASRSSLTNSQTAITLDRLRNCQQAIYKVAAFLYGPVLWKGSYAAVPVPQYDHLENLDKRWVSKSSAGTAHQYWNRNLEDIEKWETESLWPEKT